MWLSLYIEWVLSGLRQYLILKATISTFHNRERMARLHGTAARERAQVGFKVETKCGMDGRVARCSAADGGRFALHE